MIQIRKRLTTYEFFRLLVLVSATAISISVPTFAQEANIETKVAIVTTDTAEGNYFEFLDKTGGWWLESDGEHPTFEVRQVMQFTIDNQMTEDPEDDELLVVESLGFVETEQTNTKPE